VRASLFKAAGLYAAASIINGVLPFALLPILTRFMPPAEFALTVMFTTFATFANAFTGLNLHGAVNVRFFAQTDASLVRYVSTCCVVMLAGTALTAIVTLVAHPVFSSLVGLPLPWLLAAVAFSASQGFIQLRLVCWQAANAAVPYVTFQLALAFVTAGLSIVLVVAFARGWYGRVEAQVAVIVVFAAAAVGLLARDGLLRATFDRPAALDALAYGVPLIPHSIGALLIAMSDRVLVASALGLHEAGIYAAGMQVGLITSLLADAFNRAYNPWLYSRLALRDHAVRVEIVRFSYQYFLVALIVGIAIGLAAPLIAALLIDAQYAEAARYSFWISVGGAFQGMYYMVGLLIAYARKTHWLAIVTVTGGLLNVPLTLGLIDVNGALGAAQAYAITQALFFAATWMLSARFFPMPWFGTCKPTGSS